MSQTPERSRAYEKTPERRAAARERARKWRAANPELSRERGRQYRAANPERVRETRQNPKYKTRTMRQRHGSNIAEEFSAMWEAQDGCCYLCKEPLVRDRTVIDHDHAHCGPERSCPFCRRGLAHNHCNFLIGAANDNPQLLRAIADNFEPVLKATRARIAAAPRQELLI